MSAYQIQKARQPLRGPSYSNLILQTMTSAMHSAFIFETVQLVFQLHLVRNFKPQNLERFRCSCQLLQGFNEVHVACVEIHAMDLSEQLYTWVKPLKFAPKLGLIENGPRLAPQSSRLRINVWKNLLWFCLISWFTEATSLLLNSPTSRRRTT